MPETLRQFLSMQIDPRRLVNGIASLLVGVAMMYYGHGLLERELAREPRNYWMVAAGGLIVLVGAFVVPTIRGRVLPAATATFDLIRLGRRAGDKVAIVVDPAPPDGPT
jgi:hypothetical protein